MPMSGGRRIPIIADEYVDMEVPCLAFPPLLLALPCPLSSSLRCDAAGMKALPRLTRWLPTPVAAVRHRRAQDHSWARPQRLGHRQAGGAAGHQHHEQGRVSQRERRQVSAGTTHASALTEASFASPHGNLLGRCEAKIGADHACVWMQSSNAPNFTTHWARRYAGMDRFEARKALWKDMEVRIDDGCAEDALMVGYGGGKGVDE